MKITQVEISTMAVRNDNSGKLRAYAAIVFDDVFKVRDLRIVESQSGQFHVSMPSKRQAIHCGVCYGKNPAGVNYCNNCGEPIPLETSVPNGQYRHIDQCHPIDKALRAEITTEVLHAYEVHMAGGHDAPVPITNGLNSRIHEVKAS